MKHIKETNTMGGMKRIATEVLLGIEEEDSWGMSEEREEAFQLFVDRKEEEREEDFSDSREYRNARSDYRERVNRSWEVAETDPSSTS